VGGGARGHHVSPLALLAPDCGTGVGLGHLERMLALADSLRPDLEVRVLLPEGDEMLRQRVVGRGHLPLELPGETAVRAAGAVRVATPPDVVVLDGYVFDVEMQRGIRDRAVLTVVDDLGLPCDCDLAVNPSPGGGSMRPSGARAFLGGASFALVRAAFVEARELVVHRGRARRTVLVSTGATDAGRLGARVSAELLDGDATLEVIRIVGPDTEPGASHDRQREHRLVAPAGLAEALTQTTIYVGAAGTTAVQAACVGIPAVINAVVPNQVAQAAALDAAGCAVVADIEDLAGTVLRLLDDPSRCDEMAAHGRALVDGQGASRVAEAVRGLAAARAA
jgi:UDP-2,4-diacetamido-2,4,6-trideoxy-beta-L-altropyranose hydrolase